MAIWLWSYLHVTINFVESSYSINATARTLKRRLNFSSCSGIVLVLKLIVASLRLSTGKIRHAYW